MSQWRKLYGKIKKLDDLLTVLKSNKEKKVVSVAYGQDLHTLQAVSNAIKEGIVQAVILPIRMK